MHGGSYAHADAGIRAPGGRYAIVVARFHESITKRLAAGAEAALRARGVLEDGVETFWVPGSFELPLAAQTVAQSGRFRGVVCLGCLIRGETAHFEIIAQACADGLMQVALDTGLPMGFGVLTTDTPAQAEARAIDGPDNKGYEAALAVVEMAALAAGVRGGG